MPKVKKIGKQKAKVIHPSSRKAAQLVREAHRKERLERRKAERSLAVSNKVVELMWFREHIDETKLFYTTSEMLELIESYLRRLDDELEELVRLQSDKTHFASHYRQQHASKEDAIRSVMVRERELFEGAGFEAPDLRTQKLFKIFVEWKGEENLLPKIALAKYRSE